MTKYNIVRRARLGSALAAMALCLGTAVAPSAAIAQPGTFKPQSELTLSVGEGQMINTGRPVADVWVSNPLVADVDVTNPRQIKLFGKERGVATLIATGKDGGVVYATNVRVSQNISSVDDVIRAALPGSNITVTTVGQTAIINGTVASPEDSADAERIVRAVLNPGIAEGAPLNVLPINRLRAATPVQVALRVKIAEVNRSLIKEVGVNLLGGNRSFDILQGDGIYLPPAGEVPEPTKDATGAIIRGITGTTLALRKSILGLDLISRLQLSETDGLVTTLAEPTLTALSGETASFLAGGEFPVPISSSLGSVTVEYKQYGVGLAFTPIVMTDGRISMRVRPEVSELSTEGSVKFGDFVIPALTTRRAETTVELGSGQSFMIAGLLRNSNVNDINKAPFLGDIPILGALFRSTKYRRAETELVIIVTPYLVRPVNGQLALPTNGYRAPSTGQMLGMGQSYSGVSGAAPAPASAGAAPAPGFKM
ncbi:type II and III secretion system protein family protein [Sphingomonas mesophila]|uniref:type II and III secretion system protein family protein n=1 Tax=Sphingomonas mesophila TaxID=2303576 RepID=UPI000E56A884|nr:type II and III secretion system protein family protein [Sphingomonas mesophila]